MCFQAAILQTVDFHVLMGKIVIGFGQQIGCDRVFEGKAGSQNRPAGGWMAISGYGPRKSTVSTNLSHCFQDLHCRFYR